MYILDTNGRAPRRCARRRAACLAGRASTAGFRGSVLPIDTVVAEHCARLHVPGPQAERDALIAATALVHGMTVVTRNVADFAATGVPLLNPSQP